MVASQVILVHLFSKPQRNRLLGQGNYGISTLFTGSQCLIQASRSPPSKLLRQVPGVWLEHWVLSYGCPSVNEFSLSYNSPFPELTFSRSAPYTCSHSSSRYFCNSFVRTIFSWSRTHTSLFGLSRDLNLVTGMNTRRGGRRQGLSIEPAAKDWDTEKQLKSKEAHKLSLVQQLTNSHSVRPQKLETQHK